MTKRNEKTSPRVAKIAGKVMKYMQYLRDDSRSNPCNCCLHRGLRDMGIRASDLKALAASCLTQAEDKKKGKA